MYKTAKAKLLNTILSITAVLFNLAQPFAFALTMGSYATPSYAQEVSIEPSADLVSPEPSATAEPSVEPTPTPTLELTPEPTVEPSAIPVESASPEPSTTPEPSSTPEPTSSPKLSASVEPESISTNSDPSFDFSATEVTSATLTTDKADYSPYEKVVITAADLLPLTTYEIEISSSDPPAVTHTDLVSSDDNGTFTYTYQLDGNYRPNYTINLYLAGVLIASTTFTDTHTPVYDYQVDTAGANDEPGQKDLTQMGVDYLDLPATLYTTWNWDETGWSGNNSGDACNLFDTDNDGNANYSLCVIVKGDPATYDSQVLYSCGDARADRCTNPIVVLPDTATCSTSITNSDPFPAGDEYPQDTTGYCEIPMSDIGSGDAELIDVCSYPSGQPNSDPSDCIVFRKNTAKLEIQKVLVPANDPGLFNLLIDGSPHAINVGNGGTTGEVQLDVDNNGTTYSVSETAGTNTSLTNYATTHECRDLNGTGSVVTSGSNTGPFNLTLNADEDVVCVFTNTLNQGTLTVVKHVDNQYNGPLSASNFTVYLKDEQGTNVAGSPTAGSETGTQYSLLEGTYTVSEDPPPTGYEQISIICDGQATNSVQVVAGQDKTCTITNSDQPGTLKVYKVTEPTDTSVEFSITTTGGTVVGDATQTIQDGTPVEYSVHAGTYDVTEAAKDGWTETGNTCVDVVVTNGQTSKCTITNTKKGSITVVKDMVGGTGSFDFTGDLAGTIDTDLAQLSLAVAPGAYTTNEGVITGWDLTAIKCSDNDSTGDTSTRTATFRVAAGEDVTCTFTNTKFSSISGYKWNDLDGDGYWDQGEPALKDWKIFLTNPDQTTTSITTDDNGYYLFDLLLPGSYGLAEEEPASWTQTYASTGVVLGAGQESEDNNFGNFKNFSISGIKFNDLDGDGIKDAGEPPLSGWEIYLSGTKTATTLTAADGSYSFTNLGPGSYTVSEDTTVPGWTQTKPVGPGTYSFTAVSGQNKTGYDFGNHATGKITLNKDVINNHGGTAGINDFGLSIGATSVDSGETLTLPAFKDYALTEVGLTGYSFVSLTGDAKCPSTLGGKVNLAPNDNVTCTISNDDDGPSLTLKKVVVNDNGGSAVPADWTLTAIGPSIFAGQGPIVQNGNGFKAGTYDLSESGPSGYAASEWVCVGGTQDDKDTVTLGLGESATCTITNDDLAPTLKLVKEVDGGNSKPGDWTLSARTLCVNGSTDPACGFSDTGDSSTFHPLSANRLYTLFEAGPDGYTGASWECDGGNLVGNRLTLALSDAVTCKIKNTRDTGKVIINKVIDVDGDLQTTNDQTPGENWQFDVDGWAGDTSDPVADTTDSLGSVTFSDLKTGQYTAVETLVKGYDLVDVVCGNQTGTFDGIDSIDAFTVVKDTTTTCTFYNTPNGVLHGRKFHDANLDESPLGDDLLPGWTIKLAKWDGNDYVPLDSFVTDDSTHYGWYWFEHLFPGDYQICEEQQVGFAQTYPGNDGCHYVTLPEESSGPVLSAQLENFVSGPAYDFGNVALGQVVVTKFSDDDGDGYWDQNEAALPDWTINLDQDGFHESKETNGNGQATFDNLYPATYTLSEVQQEWYNLTNIYCDEKELVLDRVFTQLLEVSEPTQGQHTFRLKAGETKYCYVGNEPVAPVLTLSKSNDASGTKSPNDLVTFTLVVKLTGSPLYDVKVIDLPAEGFEYLTGSWTSSKAGVGEPTYASPGTWSLGSMDPGEEVTLTYQTKIKDGLDDGTYRDLAYAFGCARPTENCQPENEYLVMDQGVDSPYLDEAFVGTEVTLGVTNPEVGGVDIEGEVLGASTSLPATGSDTRYLALALTLVLTGLTTLLAGLKLRKSLAKLLAVALFLGFSLTAVKPVEAASPYLSVRVESPESPTRAGEFELAFTALDMKQRPITLSCFYRQADEAGYTQFDSSKNLISGGNSGTCQVNNTILTDQGDYYFKVVASVDGESEESNVAVVTYDSIGPDKPVSYRKEHPDTCRWVIKFKTANDSQTSKVVIFSSRDTEFETNDATKVGEVNIGPNSEGEYTHNRAGDCDGDWYYVIRAYDVAGNDSDYLGDSVVTVTTGATETEARATGISQGTVLGQEADGAGESGDGETSGEVLGQEGEEAVETVEEKRGGILGDFENAAADLKEGNVNWWLVGLGVVIVIAVYYAFTRPKKN